MKVVKKLQIMLLVMLLNLSIPLGFSADAVGEISVEINGLKNSDGFVMVSLFADADAFPIKPEKAYKKLRGKINSKMAQVQFVDVPHGEYAIAVYHDENTNGKLDTNFIGIPNEGLGSSNDARGRFGPPKFIDAKFRLNEDQKNLSITVTY